jgi:hypothetical protein
MLARMLASALGDSLALAAVFFVLFPAIVTGLIVFAVGQALGERRANEEYKLRRRQNPSRG